MNLSINALKNTFIPKGNGIVRQYNKNNNVRKYLNGIALTSAAGGVATLATKDPSWACVFAGLSLGSTALANYFNKNAMILKNQFDKIVARASNIELAQ